MHKTAIALALLANIGTAFAAEKTGPYIYGNIGGTNSPQKLSDKTTDTLGSILFRANPENSGNSSTISFEIGTGYRVNNNFAIEAGYYQTGKFRNKELGDLNSRALRLSGLAIAPIGENFEVYGKASLYGVQDKFSSHIAQIDSSKTHKMAYSLGVGAAYHINKSVSIKTELDYMQSFKQKSPMFKKDNRINFNVGLNYHF